MGYPISVGPAGDGQGDSNFMTQLELLDPPPSLESPSLEDSSSLNCGKHHRGLVDVNIGSVNLFMSLPSPQSSVPKSTEDRVTDLNSQDTETQNIGPSQVLSPTPDSDSEPNPQVVPLQGTSTSSAPLQTHYQELSASIEISASEGMGNQ